ncbi:MAG: YihY/virulence factor BrkB family protein, partial [Muribaculaceae bacterium]|nr:YihY/virulence factor BrkB family protein [Muribaculaceae bacterium]
VEDTFNLVWDVKEGRGLWRKLSDYTAMLIVLPVLLLCSGGINLMLSNTLQSLLHWQFMTPLVSIFMEVGSWVLTWLFFTLSYVAIPNTRVRFLNALTAGGIAAVGFLVLQWLFVTGQLYVSRYNAIYGSFSFVPLLLIWLQLVWVITIAGAVICYSSQNIFQFNFANETEKISLSYRRRVVLAIAAVVVDRFDSDSPAITVPEIVGEYGIPSRLVTDALSRLERSGIVSRVIVDERKNIIGYQPAMPTDDLSVATVWERLDRMGESDFVPDFNRRFPGVVDCCDSIADTIRIKSTAILLRDLKISPAPKR